MRIEDNQALTRQPVAIIAVWIQTELYFMSATRQSTINTFSKRDTVEIVKSSCDLDPLPLQEEKTLQRPPCTLATLHCSVVALCW